MTAPHHPARSGDAAMPENVHACPGVVDPYYADESVTLHLGDCLDVLAGMPDSSVDAIVTDPPYGLGFMGKAWDDLPPGLPWAQECLRVLKPGGHLLAFGGARTWHRLAVAVEDAGFEVRDSIAWLYGSGFPKSLNLTGERQGWGTALKPAHEPIVVARKHLVGTVAANVRAHGTGALNIDGCRVPTPAGQVNPSIARRQGSANHLSTRPASEAQAEGKVESRTTPERFRAERAGETLGRWPSNVVLDDAAAAELDKQSGTLTSGKMNPTRPQGGNRNTYGQDAAAGYTTMETYGDSGGASRFFPTFRYQAKAPTRERPTVVAEDGTRTAHPTVKPLALMRWLVRLVTPPGGVVLDPFAGSGTTAEACTLEGFHCVAIEREAAYLPLIMARLSKSTEPDLSGDAA